MMIDNGIVIGEITHPSTRMRAWKDIEFFKLTNESECHNGFHFKTGLNIDDLPFNYNVYDPCGMGRLYFAPSDAVLGWIKPDHRFIRKVHIPDDEEDVVLFSATHDNGKIYRPAKIGSHSIILEDAMDLKEMSTWITLIKKGCVNETTLYGVYIWTLCNPGMMGILDLFQEFNLMKYDYPLILERLYNVALQSNNSQIAKLLDKRAKLNKREIHTSDETVRICIRNNYLDSLQYLIETKKIDISKYTS